MADYRRGSSRLDRNTPVNNAEGDSWIWGKHRGGGGAPIVDDTGSNITNLKVGTTNIISNNDYSVAPSPAKRQPISPVKRITDDTDISEKERKFQ